MTKQCATCGNSFEHIQQGRGRPPKFCPSCREAKYAPAKNTTVTVVEEQVEERTLKAGVPNLGDKVVHIGLGISAKYYRVGKLVEKDESKDSAVVLLRGERMSTRLSKLSLFS